VSAARAKLHHHQPPVVRADAPHDELLALESVEQPGHASRVGAEAGGHLDRAGLLEEPRQQEQCRLLRRDAVAFEAPVQRGAHLAAEVEYQRRYGLLIASLDLLRLFYRHHRERSLVV